MIGIIDLGIGNVNSIQRIISKAGGNSVVLRDPTALDTVQKVILPGVGHFDFGMRRMKDLGFDIALTDMVIDSRITVLGICLGMQMLCNNSEEGRLSGLSLIDAEVHRVNPPASLNLKVPHMGWNTAHTVRTNPLLPYTKEEQRFYFVHSFKVVLTDPNLAIAHTSYGGDFCSAFQKDKVYGVQFHPEKSHRFGLTLFRRFVDL